jgi:hypothetical protein
MVHEFTLYLAGDPVTDAQVEALYEAGLDDGTVVTRGQVTHIGVDREAETLETAIRSAIAQVVAAGLVVREVAIPAEIFAPQEAR